MAMYSAPARQAKAQQSQRLRIGGHQGIQTGAVECLIVANASVDSFARFDKIIVSVRVGSVGRGSGRPVVKRTSARMPTTKMTSNVSSRVRSLRGIVTASLTEPPVPSTLRRPARPQNGPISLTEPSRQSVPAPTGAIAPNPRADLVAGTRSTAPSPELLPATISSGGGSELLPVRRTSSMSFGSSRAG